VTGYGAGLRTTATARFSDYFAPDAVYSLFKYDAPLQDPETAWRRLIAAWERSRRRRTKSGIEGVHKEVQALLKHVLDLSENAEINLEPNGIFVQENEERIPLDAMGDGHRALVKLTLDILVWFLLKLNEDREGKGEQRNWRPIPIDQDGRPKVEGIVIIDEIEQHLHPKLQRGILKRLYDKFPHVQFIMTTHSPLCVSGTADTGDKGFFRY
jgi:predicted ATP-binding protein involved in virulence